MANKQETPNPSDDKYDDDNNDDHDNTGTFDTFQEIKIGKSVLPVPTPPDGSPEAKKKKQCFCTRIFLPFGRFIFWWDVFLMHVLLMSIIEIPYSLAFHVWDDMHPGDPVAIIAFLIDLCLVFDIFLNFRTAYIDKYDRLRIIPDPKLIAKRYLRTWFTVDFLSSTPFTYVLLVFAHQNSAATNLKWFNLLRILKLFRIAKVLKMFHHFRENSLHLGLRDNRGTKTFLKLVRIVGVMLLIAHYFACIWYGVGSWQYAQGNPSWIDKIDLGDDDLSAAKMGNFERYSVAFCM